MNRSKIAYLDKITAGDYVNIVRNAVHFLKNRGDLSKIIKPKDTSALKKRAKEFQDLGLSIDDKYIDSFFDWDESDPGNITELIRRATALFKAVAYAESNSIASIPGYQYSLDMPVRIEHTAENDKYREARPNTSVPQGSDYSTYVLAFKENELAAISTTSFGMFQIIPGRYSPNSKGFAELLKGPVIDLNNWAGRTGDVRYAWELLIGHENSVNADDFYGAGDKILNTVDDWDKPIGETSKTIFPKWMGIDEFILKSIKSLANVTFSPTKVNWNLYSLATLAGNYFFYPLGNNNQGDISLYLSSLWYAYVPIMYNFWGAPASVATNINLEKNVFKWPDTYHGIHNEAGTFAWHMQKLNANQELRNVILSGQWPKVSNHDEFGKCCLYDSKLLYAFIQFYNDPDLVSLNPDADRYAAGYGNSHVTTTVISYFGAIGKVMKDSLTQALVNPMYATTMNKAESDKNADLRNKIIQAMYSYVKNVDFDSSKKQKLNIVDDTILPLNVSMKIDGISGLNIGDCIEVDFLPKIYSDNTYLIIMGLDTEVDSSNNWITNIKLGVKLKGKIYDKAN